MVITETNFLPEGGGVLTNNPFRVSGAPGTPQAGDSLSWLLREVEVDRWLFHAP